MNCYIPITAQPPVMMACGVLCLGVPNCVHNYAIVPLDDEWSESRVIEFRHGCVSLYTQGGIVQNGVAREFLLIFRPTTMYRKN